MRLAYWLAGWKLFLESIGRGACKESFGEGVDEEWRKVGDVSGVYIYRSFRFVGRS